VGLHSAKEDYLKAILILEKKKGMVRSVDIAGYMGVSKPSVSHAVSNLKSAGLLTKDENFYLHLTEEGREIAEQTYEKHCFFTELLVRAGVDLMDAKYDACRMEHTISETRFQLLKEAAEKQET